MDTNLNSETPSKLLQHILLEKAVHNKLTSALNTDSPFRSFPKASTPPSGLVKNPFESLLKKKLHRSVISPSLFQTAISNGKTEVNFKWTIEEISNFKPANIDESVMEQFESVETDLETELLAQANIDKYFNEKHIIPSPFETVRNVPLISDSVKPIKVKEQDKCDEMVQTVLSLPPILPEHVEAVLKPYFSYTVNQQGESNTNLYRRLFEFDEEQESSTSVISSPAPSLNLSPIEFSPLQNLDNVENHRNFGSDADILPIPDCNLSPICPSVHNLRSHFTSRMSIDTSQNWVPDTFDQMLPDNRSLGFDSIHSPLPEALSNSTINWDMEYRHISFASPECLRGDVDTEMDVSKSNTPKSKSSYSSRQRKKLSDSFLKLGEQDDSDYNKENVYDESRFEETGKVFTRDITDAGYQTGSGLTMYDESWKSSHIFASTPTNRHKK